MHTCAVVVPLYRPFLTAAEQLSIENTLAVLAEYPLYFVGPHALEPYLLELGQQLSGRPSILTFADRFFKSIEGYNKLMMSRFFYAAFREYEYTLIVQTDALVLSNELELWCDKRYSYVGAPWFNGFTTPTLPLTLKSVGNGGFSLRRVPDFLKALSRPRCYQNILMQHWPGSWMSTAYRYVKDYHSFVYGDLQININVNEDLFWGLFVPARCKFFKVPSPTEAMSFAFEAHPDHLYQLNNHTLPFGCHAWQRYQPEFWQHVIAQKGLKLSGRLTEVINKLR